MNRIEGSSSLAAARADVGEVVVEKDQPGQPHRGKVFAAVHAHLDDVARYAGGLCAKLIREGYTGYLIRTTNDEKSGGRSTAQNILGNEQEHSKVAAAIGCKDVFELYYQNHEMDAISSLDIRGRLIFLFRYLKVDTVISFNPSGPVEGNPDHGVTGRAVEEAAWMCGLPNDFHEHMEAGIQPHPVRERYYFHVRPGQAFNRVIDIGLTSKRKLPRWWNAGPREAETLALCFVPVSPGKGSVFLSLATTIARLTANTSASSCSTTNASMPRPTTSPSRKDSITWIKGSWQSRKSTNT